MQNTYFDCNERVGFLNLETDLKVNTCIVGGGLAGLMCAYELSKRGVRTCVLEKGRIGDGETARSTAMISFAHDLIYDRLIKKHGENVAKEYFDLQSYGLNEINWIIDEHSIDCDRASRNLILFSQSKKYAKKLDKEYKAYLTLSGQVEKIETSALKLGGDIDLKILNAIKIKNQLTINPLKFLTELAKIVSKNGVQIFENTPAYTKPENKTLKVGSCKIVANHFIIATHFPYINFPGLYFLKMFQHRSHNMVISPDFQIEDMYESAEEDGFEYRPYKKDIIVGGGNVRTGKYKHQSHYKMIEKHIKEQFDIPPDQIKNRFSAQDCMTPDFMPFCGRFGCLSEGLYVVSGFNKWGFTNSAACARIIADGICGTKNMEKNIFDPMRHAALKSPAKTAAHIGITVGGFFDRLVKTDAKKLNRIQNGMGAVVKIKGKRVGVYRDENGQAHTVAAVCPHLGCALKWNKDDLSWDCPCHGSRFDVSGNILNNPATEKATVLNSVLFQKTELPHNTKGDKSQNA